LRNLPGKRNGNLCGAHSMAHVAKPELVVRCPRALSPTASTESGHGQRKIGHGTTTDHISIFAATGRQRCGKSTGAVPIDTAAVAAD
jgi:hypothetical protein